MQARGNHASPRHGEPEACPDGGGKLSTDQGKVQVLKPVVWQNLRDEVAMDVDEDEQGTQRVKRVPDYGIEVDFDSLSDGDRDVRCLLYLPLQEKGLNEWS